MSLLHLSHLLTLAVDVAIGLIVARSNFRRRANQSLLLLTAVVAAWLTCLWFGFLATNEDVVAFWVRAAIMTSLWIPITIHILRMSLVYPSLGWRRLLVRSLPWISGAAAVSFFCWTRLVLVDVHLPPGGTGVQAEPIYGPGMLAYSLYYALILGALVVLCVGDSRRCSGVQRLEIQFVLLSASVGVLFGLFFGILMPFLTRTSEAVQFLPLSVAIWLGILCYGVATRRLLDMAGFVRLGVSWLLLVLSLALLYAVVWVFSDHTAKLARLAQGFPLAHLVAAVVVAIAFPALRVRLFQLTGRLIQRDGEQGFAEALRRANDLLQAVTTRDELLDRLAGFLGELTGAESVTILLTDETGACRQAYPDGTGPSNFYLEADHPLIRVLQRHRAPLQRDMLQRMHYQRDNVDTEQTLLGWNVAFAVPVWGRDALEGILLLGDRLDGRPFTALEQDGLQLISHRAAVAFENARLYTRLTEAMAYNDILVDRLTSGVIALDANGRVHRCNREASRILGFAPNALQGRSTEELGQPLSTSLRRSLRQGIDLPTGETSVQAADGHRVPVQLGTARLHGADGQVLGALAVFHDLTAVHALQEQIRRSDRLASVGTLAAGMAHEIKNPLVTIKTFVQLLPLRYEEEEFRGSYAKLVEHEVDRINRLVNQLLSFCRPSEPRLAPMSLHAMLEETIQLIAEEARLRHMHVETRLEAPRDAILGDVDQLKQAVLNFLLNAIDAMSENGTLTLATEFAENPWRMDSSDERQTADVVAVRISDTGRGISREHIGQLFDPFFTQKADGTGLGLAVSYRILQQHGALVNVESELNKGTEFRIVFPLSEEDDGRT